VRQNSNEKTSPDLHIISVCRGCFTIADHKQRAAECQDYRISDSGNFKTSKVNVETGDTTDSRQPGAESLYTAVAQLERAGKVPEKY
jgi:5-carboxymethyl-2-hydroxymuconate isomerase